MGVSVVIPVHNEEANIAALHQGIVQAFGARAYDVLVVDDGSTDGTAAALAGVKDPHWRVIRQDHGGKCLAVYRGIREAKHARIALLDGDLQNDPADIVAMLVKMDAAMTPLDCIVGWRQSRADGVVKKVSSLIGNAVNRLVFGLRIHDATCPVKVFGKERLANVSYFRHFHRFIPALIAMQGGVVDEMPVRHLPRRYGRSHYGIRNRVFGNLRALWHVRSGKPLRKVNEHG